MPDDRQRLHQVLVRIDALAREIAPKVRELEGLKEEALRLRRRIGDGEPALPR